MVKKKLGTRPDPAGKPPTDVERFRIALGRVIAEIRDGMDLSQEAFAARLGLDQTTVAKAETGKHLWRLETWLAVNRALRVPFYELFRRAVERDSRGGKDSAMAQRRVEALDEQETALVRIWRQLTPEGRAILLTRAKACLDLYRHDDNVVPLVHETRGGRKSG